MTFKRILAASAVALAAVTVAGCPGLEENTYESGLVLHVAETHLEDRLPAPRVVSLAAPVVAFDGGYDAPSIEPHELLDSAVPPNVLAIYRAYVVVDEVHLVKCSSVAQLPGLLFDSIFPPAAAHAGHGSEPVGDRALDKPNVIDIKSVDEYPLALGDRAIAPGQYCGAHVSFARATASAYGKPTPVPASGDDPTTVPEIPNLNGKMFAMRADYCSAIDGSTCLTRTKVDIDDTGLTVPEEVEIEFNQPLELSTTLPEAYVIVGIAYGEWLANIDVTLLTSVASERQKLLDNIAASIHVYSTGNGSLPTSLTGG